MQQRIKYIILLFIKCLQLLWHHKALEAMVFNLFLCWHPFVGINQFSLPQLELLIGNNA